MARITQGCFSLLPDLTDDPHPRNCYWEMWGLPLFNVPDAATIMYEINECRKAHPNMYVKVNGFNNARGIESTAISFIVQRPAFEPGFYLVRQETQGRNIQYTIQSYAVQAAAEGSRY
jgi:ribulose-bisphosphate carboxylase small chain